MKSVYFHISINKKVKTAEKMNVLFFKQINIYFGLKITKPIKR